MKKPAPDSKKAKVARPGPKRGKENEPRLDDEILAVLVEALAAKGKFVFPNAPQAGADAIFADFLQHCRNDHLENCDELVADLVTELEETRIDSSGGNPDARQLLREIDRLLQEALADNSLSPPAMMMTGKIFADAGLPPPERLKDALGRALLQAPAAAGEDGLVANLVVQALQSGDNPFDISDFLRS